MTGEFWIIDGQSIYADGDIGDINHEGIVIQHMFSRLVDDLSGSERFSELADIWSPMNECDGVDICMAREAMNNMVDEWLAEGIITEEESDDIEEAIRLEIEWEQEALDVALGNVNDARDYGILGLGWIRVLGHNVQMREINKNTLSELADGLYDCYQEDWDTVNYFLEDSTNQVCYSDVPASVIDSGNMLALRQYRV